MPLDAMTLRALATELSVLDGAKIEKINMPSESEVLLHLYSPNIRSPRLQICAASGAGHVNLTSASKDGVLSAVAAPNFCMLLRRHLSGARVSAITADGCERVLTVAFSAYDEMGYTVEKRLICELIGNYCNLIFTDADGKILGLLRQISLDNNSGRALLVGMKYTPPTAQNKIDIRADDSRRLFADLSAAVGTPIHKFALDRYLGFSPLLAREVSHRATGGVSTVVGAENIAEIIAVITAFSEDIKGGTISPCVLSRGENPYEFSFADITQYGLSVEKRKTVTLSEAIELFYKERERSARRRAAGADISKILHSARGRLERKIDAQTGELAECEGRDGLRRTGELIMSNLHLLRGNPKSADVVDYYDPEMPTVKITLDGRLSPNLYAAKLFKQYEKYRKAEGILSAQIAVARDELSYIASVEQSLSTCATPEEFEEIRAELRSFGILSDTRKRKNASSSAKSSPKKASKPPKTPSTRPEEFVTSGGFRVLCGHNNLQNERLTLHTAAPEDWFFHAKGAPGSHVILITDGREPSERDFTEAATIAAKNSAFSGGQVAVDYTRVKNVKKPPGSHPGYVIYKTNYTAYVDS